MLLLMRRRFNLNLSRLFQLFSAPSSVLSQISLAALAMCSVPVSAADQTAIQTAPVQVAAEKVISEKNSITAKSLSVSVLPDSVRSDPNETHIRAEQMTGRPSRILNFDGQVEIIRGPSTIDADAAEYHAVEDLVMANGNVRMVRNKDCYSGDTLQMQMDTGAGYLSNPVYQLGVNNARGFAKRITFVDEEQSLIEQGVYTTCAGTKPDWYLKSSRLNLDTGRDEGMVLGGMVYFKEVPILGSPWLSFPISGARRSGILPPVYSSTTAGGIELTTPYYVNIAPNRDATLFPKYISKRGLQLGGEFRYLEPKYNGTFFAEVTPKDQLTDSTRYSLSYLHNQTLLPGLSMNWNYNRASDDQYAVDYSHSVTESSTHLLPQNFSLVYGKTWGYVGALTSNYQVLQDANQGIVKPYQILPKLFAHLGNSDDFGGFDWTLDTEYANFLSSTVVSVKRSAVNAQVSYPISGTYYFVTPKVLYHSSNYQLKGNMIPGTPSNLSLSVPTFSLDSGLYFDRDTTLSGRKITQTLEPRLFYVKTPYRNQSDIPLIDTSVSDLNFFQFFTENRFSGQDRVSDANQITAGLISRAIETDGQERIRLGVAQRFSFSEPRVADSPIFALGESQNGQAIATTHPTLPGKSDLIFAANGKLTDTLSANAVWQYNQSQHSNTQYLILLSIGIRQRAT